MKIKEIIKNPFFQYCYQNFGFLLCFNFSLNNNFFIIYFNTDRKFNAFTFLITLLIAEQTRAMTTVCAHTRGTDHGKCTY